MDILIDPNDVASTAWCFIKIDNCTDKDCDKCGCKTGYCSQNFIPV